MLTSLFSLFYVTDEFHRFLHRGRATNTDRPRSIYQYSNMDLSLSRQTSIFGGVFFVFKSLLGIERQKKL